MVRDETNKEPVRSFEVLSARQEAHALQLSCRVPRDLDYFRGHFEGIPVVAGVVQLKWVDEAIRRFFGRQLAVTGMEAVKFHQLLFPESLFTMEIQHHPDKGKWSYRITTETGKVASGRLLERAREVKA